jgi:hypothetical protein
MAPTLEEYQPKVYNKYHKDYPKGSIYIGRGSFYGNEFIIGVHGNRDQCCDMYEEAKLQDPEFIKIIKKNLKGKDLICYCKPSRCHGDFLLRVANED